MQDRRGGEVFECVNARLPGGCGKTIHCSACVVRRSVTTTHRTSLPQSMVPATLKRSSPAGPVNVALQITTVKVGEMVMLRIDRMG
jgi:ferredoxin